MQRCQNGNGSGISWMKGVFAPLLRIAESSNIGSSQLCTYFEEAQNLANLCQAAQAGREDRI